MNPILIQTISYGTVLAMALVILSLLQRGFFWKYIKVKMSFGKYLLVKVRAINRDYFRVGHIEEAFLVYKAFKDKKRLSIESRAIYRCLGIQWVDVDESKNAVMEHDYHYAPGFDAEKYNNLYLRALYRPVTLDKREALVIILIIVAVVAAAIGTYFSFRNSADISTLATQVKTITSATIQAGGL